jgi:hypothetical protein
LQAAHRYRSWALAECLVGIGEQSHTASNLSISYWIILFSNVSTVCWLCSSDINDTC